MKTQSAITDVNGKTRTGWRDTLLQDLHAPLSKSLSEKPFVRTEPMDGERVSDQEFVAGLRRDAELRDVGSLYKAADRIEQQAKTIEALEDDVQLRDKRIAELESRLDCDRAILAARTESMEVAIALAKHWEKGHKDQYAFHTAERDALQMRVTELQHQAAHVMEGWKCECSTDDACRFAQERDALQAKVTELEGESYTQRFKVAALQLRLNALEKPLAFNDHYLTGAKE